MASTIKVESMMPTETCVLGGLKRPWNSSKNERSVLSNSIRHSPWMVRMKMDNEHWVNCNELVFYFIYQVASAKNLSWHPTTCWALLRLWRLIPVWMPSRSTSLSLSLLAKWRSIGVRSADALCTDPLSMICSKKWLLSFFSSRRKHSR